MRQLVGVVGLQTSHVILCDFERTLAEHPSTPHSRSFLIFESYTSLSFSFFVIIAY